MIIVNTHEAKTKLSHLLMLIEQNHETVRVCRHGKPVADIVPIMEIAINSLQQHAELSNIQIHYDPSAPLAEDEWPEGEN
jgi:antitoxin (DNA-binding transcriptional repressor) of toxin-antitoxin stability system